MPSTNINGERMQPYYTGRTSAIGTQAKAGTTRAYVHPQLALGRTCGPKEPPCAWTTLSTEWMTASAPPAAYTHTPTCISCVCTALEHSETTGDTQELQILPSLSPECQVASNIDHNRDVLQRYRPQQSYGLTTRHMPYAYIHYTKYFQL
jgi:hypothetical protein